MKKLLVLVLVMIAASVSAEMYADRVINQSELPEAAQTFIERYFAADKVVKVEQDYGKRGVEYEVDFASGAEVDFRGKGEWHQVKAARGGEVPAGIVPEAVAKYVAANFATQRIVEIERKRGGYEIELSNGTELRLTADGQPLAR